jgi:hypothetical protein
MQQQLEQLLPLLLLQLGLGACWGSSSPTQPRHCCHTSPCSLTWLLTDCLS